MLAFLALTTVQAVAIGPYLPPDELYHVGYAATVLDGCLPTLTTPLPTDRVPPVCAVLQSRCTGRRPCSAFWQVACSWARPAMGRGGLGSGDRPFPRPPARSGPAGGQAIRPIGRWVGGLRARRRVGDQGEPDDLAAVVDLGVVGRLGAGHVEPGEPAALVEQEAVGTPRSSTCSPTIWRWWQAERGPGAGVARLTSAAGGRGHRRDRPAGRRTGSAARRRPGRGHRPDTRPGTAPDRAGRPRPNEPGQMVGRQPLTQVGGTERSGRGRRQGSCKPERILREQLALLSIPAALFETGWYASTRDGGAGVDQPIRRRG